MSCDILSFSVLKSLKVPKANKTISKEKIKAKVKIKLPELGCILNAAFRYTDNKFLQELNFTCLTLYFTIHK